MARIPENRVLRLKRYKEVKSLLKLNKGREPDTLELADALGWAPQAVITTETSLRKDLSSSHFQDTDLDVEAKADSRLKETVEMLYYELTPEERLVYDYSMGRHGKPAVDVNEMEKETGIQAHRIYEIKKKLAKRVQESL
jgi:DNA-directed RNA polymerase sigma subunit (sigma70/sigma32)